VTVLPDELEDLWHDFRRSLARRNRSASTVTVYRKSFESFWTWAIDNGIAPDPAAVTGADINRWTDHLLETVVMRNGRAVEAIDPKTGARAPKMLEASTRRIRFINLRPFFGWWAREFEAPNPFDRADVPGEDQAVPIPVVPLDDVRRLLATCTTRDFADVRDTAIIRVLYDTGARLGELVALTVDDWDRRNDFLTLRGKTGTRVVPISASTGEALSRYLRVRRTHSQAKRPALWLGTKGHLGDSGFAQVLRRRCELAGIGHINPHRFRHTWAHTFRAEGGSEGDLMYLAGWKSTAMAHRYGRSAAAERAQETMRRLSLGDQL
jgi:site-specific recombinase XerD